MVTLAVAAARPNPVQFSMIMLGLVFPCCAFAWDGLVRRQMAVPLFPFGSGLPGRAALISRIKAAAIGLLAALIGLVCLLLALASFQVAIQRTCHGSSACFRSLLGSVDWQTWAWFGLWACWFGFVWLRMGDPRKRVLVYGVWYHQEKVARLIDRQLQAQGLAPVPRPQVYALEERVVRLMRAHGWLVYGEAWLDGGTKREAQPIPVNTMLQEVLSEPAFKDMGESEQIAIELLLTYFQTQAQRGQQMSPLRRWWVGWAQRGKLGVYGRRRL